MAVWPEGLQEALGAGYTLERELGRGGMATVYLAHDLKHDRRVAIKVLHAELSAMLGADRFLQEIRITANLQHPHILGLIDSGVFGDDAGELQGRPYYVMPYVDGESLRQRLEREEQLPVPDAVRIASEIAGALDYAHRHGVIHRDIKPENILLHEGSVMVADFGIALAVSAAGGSRITQPGLSLGTPQYMSPEQAMGGQTITTRTDIYSLGAVTYEMLAGEPPFTGPNSQAIIAKVITSEPHALTAQRKSVPVNVEAAVRTALERTPADRFASASEFASALADPAFGTKRIPQMRRDFARRHAIQLAVMGVVLLVGTGLWVAQRRHLAPRQASVAVLPFVNMTPGNEMEYFSDGVTEELINALTKVDGLRIPARTSSFQFKGRAADIKDVGKRLGVGAVLEGSVRREGNKVRITAQLINVEDGYHLWSDAYDRAIKDVFTVQEEIAQGIVGALLPRLQSRAGVRLIKPGTNDSEAHNLYLRGRYAWNKRTPDGLKEAIRYFEEAIDRDPGYALAYSGVADSYISLFDYQLMSAADANPKARLAAVRALALDSSLAEPHNSLAHVLLHEWKWRESEAEFRHALELNPALADTYHWYALALTALGRLDEAIAAMKQAEQLDPLSARMSADLGMAYYAARQYDRAIDQERKTLRLEPTFATAHWIMGMANEQKGKLPEATQSLEAALRLRPGNPNYLAELARSHALAGRKTEARKILADLLRRGTNGDVSPFFIALVYTALNEKDRAFEWLEKSVAARSGSVRYLKVEPRLDPLRADPRFNSLLEKVGLPR